MRYFLLVLNIGLITFLAAGCGTRQPETKIKVVTYTQTPMPVLTSTPISTSISMPTPERFDVIEIVPSHRCSVTIDKDVFTVSWKNDEEFVFAYYPLVERSGSETPIPSELQWLSHNIKTGEEIPEMPFINFDNTFWERNHLNNNALNPELAGYFSPSGKYVIYTVFLGKSFEPTAKNEIWVAETNGKQKWKIFEAGGNALNISRAAWFEDETKVIFNMAYEGPTEFYVSDFKGLQTVKLSEISQFSGFTEETWRLSPDGKTLAVVDRSRELLLVSLETGKTQVVESYGGSFPQWSSDGNLLFYWWRADKDNWWGNIDQLRAFEIGSQKISTLLDQAALVAGFNNYQGDDNCIARDYYLLGLPYAISPDQKSILVWDNGLYMLMKK